MRNKSPFHIFIAIFLIITVAGCTSRQKIEATLFGGGEDEEASNINVVIILIRFISSQLCQYLI